jgi:hypothetical protein
MAKFPQQRATLLLLFVVLVAAVGVWLVQAPQVGAQAHKECHWECWDSEFVDAGIGCVPSDTPNCTSCILVCHGDKDDT